ncbi:hypothetical protein M427DRAFT_58368 [Gonapodya prolifera JEL478]|uniref:Uncharacterized protein n=1 Tax=Gonapodya prolifera (strain JEL478) TaxID=1344416 RepID=A0A139ABD2_GONPJ|nr:hypothetical protein M427DRAFT_58368 [Gonapodya prolifera JEL478]|eukprot:KXS13775.1 hypothetical protein M427DRAFT_58368 [Gonapodya prolifera JEL478]
MAALACFLVVGVLATRGFAQTANLGYTPAIIYWDGANYSGTSAQTGGTDGDCFGIGVDVQSYKLSPSTSARFYSDWGCQGSDLGVSSTDSPATQFSAKPLSVRLNLGATSTTVNLGYTPGVQLFSLANFGGWSSQTGGNAGCFGFDNPSGSFKLTSGATATFYSDWGCTGNVLLTAKDGNANPNFSATPKSVKWVPPCITKRSQIL